MASSKWKTFQELAEVTKGKKVIFWGASNWIERTLEELKMDVAYIIDKSKLNQGITYCGFDVFGPEKLDQENRDDIFIIIATSNYISVIEDLDKLDFVMGEEYCCTPLLNKRKDKDDMMQHEQKVLVSSQQHWFDEKAGGGLYTYNTLSHEIDKVYSGKCRGIVKDSKHYYAIDMLRGVVVFDHAFKEVGLVELSKNCEPHGLHVDEKRNELYIGQPGRDSVAIFSLKNNKLLKEIFISDKWSANKKDNHHVNDPYVYGDSLYISLFSFSGNWLTEVYDGGILEIDLKTGKILGPVITGAWMPHSVKRFNGKICYLDSMTGVLWGGTYEKMGQFSGFARGLDYDGKYYYVGVTEHRYPEKLDGLSYNIGLDAGFYMLDAKTKMTRFFNMSHLIEALHCVMVL